MMLSQNFKIMFNGYFKTLYSFEREKNVSNDQLGIYQS